MLNRLTGSGPAGAFSLLWPGPDFVYLIAGGALAPVVPVAGFQLIIKGDAHAHPFGIAGEKGDVFGILAIFQRVSAAASAEELLGLGIDGRCLSAARSRSPVCRFAGSLAVRNRL